MTFLSYFFFACCLDFFLHTFNISGVVRTLPFFAWTCLHILSILNAFLVLWESWGATWLPLLPGVDTFSDYCIYLLLIYYIYYLLLCVYYIYTITYGKEHLFSFTLTRFMSFYFYKIWVKPNVIYSYLQWKYLRTPGCSQSRLIAWWPTLPQEDIIANFLLYSVANTGLADTVF